MGGGSTPINNGGFSGQGMPTIPGLECSSAYHIANQQNITTYPFPSVTHKGIQSTKILTSADQFFGKW